MSLIKNSYKILFQLRRKKSKYLNYFIIRIINLFFKFLCIQIINLNKCPPHQQCLSRRTLPSYVSMRPPSLDSSMPSHTTCRKKTTSTDAVTASLTS